MSSYADLTVNDPNPIKRRLHQRRVEDCLRPLAEVPPDFAGRILDCGGGDGELCRRMARRYPNAEIVCYEPIDYTRAEALEKLRGLPNVSVAARLDALPTESFDWVFCTGVLEHLPPREADALLDEMERLARGGASIVVEVPNELHLAALLKGAFRASRRYGDFDATLRNVLRATFGRPPTQRPRDEKAPGWGFYYHHMGFDHRVCRRTLESRFDVAETFGSPFPWLPIWLSVEIYFVCTRVDVRSTRR